MSNNGDVLLYHLLQGNFKDALETVYKVVKEFNTNDASCAEAKDQILRMKDDPVGRLITKGTEKILGYIKDEIKTEFSDGLDKFKSAGKEVLSCIGNVFTAIKEGLENSFDSIKMDLVLHIKN